MSEPSHLKQYLDYYKTVKNPGFAVLVTGEWGVGKTYQVKKALRDHPHLFVSLFGLTRIEDVNCALFAEAHPETASWKEVLGLVGNAADGVGGWWSLANIPSKLLNGQMEKSFAANQTIILDDLERYAGDNKEIEGFIARLVEEQKCQVIIISHDEKYVETFQSTKEKFIGHTIRALPQIEDAFLKFLEKLDKQDIYSERAIQLLQKYKGNILETFQRSEVSSLRILFQTMMDISRLLSEINTEYFDNERGMEALISCIAGYSFVIKKGLLSEQHILERYSRLTPLPEMFSDSIEGKPTAPEKPILEEVIERFEFADSTRFTLTPETIVKLLIHGVINVEEIEHDLDQSFHWRSNSMPPWKILWYVDEMPIEQLEQALIKFENEFLKRSRTNPHEMLHIFGIKLRLSRDGISNRSLCDAANDCMLYVDDVSTTNKFDLPNLSGLDKTDPSGYGGLGYACRDYSGASTLAGKQFDRVFDHLQAAVDRAIRRGEVSTGSELLSVLATNPQSFIEKISWFDGQAGEYYDLPVLRSINTATFLNTLLDSVQDTEWTRVGSALSVRYRNASQELVHAEKEWLVSLIGEIDKRITQESGFVRSKMSRVKITLDYTLAKLPS